MTECLKCATCQRLLPKGAFSKNAAAASGRQCNCRECARKLNEVQRERTRRDRDLYLRRKWTYTNRNAKQQGVPCMPRDEFLKWAKSSPAFNELWRARIYSLDKGYVFRLCINRIDPRFGYEPFNMEWSDKSEVATRRNHWYHHSKII